VPFFSIFNLRLVKAPQKVKRQWRKPAVFFEYQKFINNLFLADIFFPLLRKTVKEDFFCTKKAKNKVKVIEKRYFLYYNKKL